MSDILDILVTQSPDMEDIIESNDLKPAVLDPLYDIAYQSYTFNFYGPDSDRPIILTSAQLQREHIHEKIWTPVPEVLNSLIKNSAKATAGLICKRNTLQLQYDKLIQHWNADTFPPHIKCKVITHIKHDTDSIKILVNRTMLSTEIQQIAIKYNKINSDLQTVIGKLLLDLRTICKEDIIRKKLYAPFCHCKENKFFQTWAIEVADIQHLYASNIKKQQDAKKISDERKAKRKLQREIEIETRKSAAIAAGINKGNIRTTSDQQTDHDKLDKITRIIESLQLENQELRKLISGKANGGMKSNQPPLSKGNKPSTNKSNFSKKKKTGNYQQKQQNKQKLTTKKSNLNPINQQIQEQQPSSPNMKKRQLKQVTFQESKRNTKKQQRKRK